MKDKEIAKIICKECSTHKKDCIGGKANSPCLMADFCGEALYNAGYRKLPKDARVFIPTDEQYIILSRKEYKKYKKVVDGKAIMIENIADLDRLGWFLIEYDDKIFDNIADFGNYIQEQASKETAEKILFKFESAFAYYDNEDMFSKKAIFECLEEIAKQFGVEIKE